MIVFGTPSVPFCRLGVLVDSEYIYSSPICTIMNLNNFAALVGEQISRCHIKSAMEVFKTNHMIITRSEGIKRWQGDVSPVFLLLTGRIYESNQTLITRSEKNNWRSAYQFTLEARGRPAWQPSNVSKMLCGTHELVKLISLVLNLHCVLSMRTNRPFRQPQRFCSVLRTLLYYVYNLHEPKDDI